MNREAGRTYIYRIDISDNIIHINEDWLAFAFENGAPALTPGAVLNKPLWDFIAGREARHLYRMLTQRARLTGKEMTFPFRCDSPGCRRFMEMRVSAAINGSGSVDFRCRLLKLELRPYMLLLDPEAPRSPEFLTICSWCKQVRLEGDRWVEVEEAVTRLGLFGRAELPQLTHGMCPGCYALVSGSIPKPD